MCIKCGNTILDDVTVLTPLQAQHKPLIMFKPDDLSFFCLLLVDIDYPSRFTAESDVYLHWALLNIEGTDISTGYEVSYKFILKHSRPSVQGFSRIRKQ